MEKPEPCEFTSKELIAIAITGVRQAIDNPSQSVPYLFDVIATLAQAEAQLEHNSGAATPFPEPVQDALEPTPMLHTNYDALTLEERVERLELCAKLYLGWLGCESSPEKALREDCTRYWPEMKACYEGKEDA